MVSTALLRGQTVLVPGPNGHVNIFNSDLAVLEAGETRKDLVCTVTPAKPALGFDLRFHTGYDVTLPLREVAGSENALNILFRVAPENHPDHPITSRSISGYRASKRKRKATLFCKADSISARVTITWIG